MDSRDEGVANVRRSYEALSRGDFDAAVEIAHPDIEFISPNGLTGLVDQAMSQENVELHYRSIDALNRRHLGVFLALMDKDVEAVPRIAAIEGGLHGHSGIRRWWDSWLEAFPDYKLDVVGMRDVGDFTIATFSAVGHGAGSELPFEDNAWLACRWRKGQCIWWQAFGAEAEALEAVGLSKQAKSQENVEIVRGGRELAMIFTFGAGRNGGREYCPSRRPCVA